MYIIDFNPLARAKQQGVENAIQLEQAWRQADEHAMRQALNAEALAGNRMLNYRYDQYNTQVLPSQLEAARAGYKDQVDKYAVTAVGQPSRMAAAEADNATNLEVAQRRKDNANYIAGAIYNQQLHDLDQKTHLNQIEAVARQAQLIEAARQAAVAANTSINLTPHTVELANRGADAVLFESEKGQHQRDIDRIPLANETEKARQQAENEADMLAFMRDQQRRMQELERLKANNGISATEFATEMQREQLHLTRRIDAIDSALAVLSGRTNATNEERLALARELFPNQQIGVAESGVLTVGFKDESGVIVPVPLGAALEDQRTMLADSLARVSSHIAEESEAIKLERVKHAGQKEIEQMKLDAKKAESVDIFGPSPTTGAASTDGATVAPTASPVVTPATGVPPMLYSTPIPVATPSTPAAITPSTPWTMGAGETPLPLIPGQTTAFKIPDTSTIDFSTEAGRGRAKAVIDNLNEQIAAANKIEDNLNDEFKQLQKQAQNRIMSDKEYQAFAEKGISKAAANAAMNRAREDKRIELRGVRKAVVKNIKALEKVRKSLEKELASRIAGTVVGDN